jgi:hypothetical protein
MAEHHHSTLRIVRAVRVRQDAPAEATPAPSRDLSNYELLERRSREREEQRARGGLGQDENDTPIEPPPGIAAPRGLGRM